MRVQQRGTMKERVGRVVSDSMRKTIVVDVERVYRHPLYGKVLRSESRCYAHDEKGEARAGDTVRIALCRPLSRLKRWRLVEVLKRGAAVAAAGGAEEELRSIEKEIREFPEKRREETVPAGQPVPQERGGE